MIIIGLTGSIGMGKTTTATMFADAGIPVHDADDAVHRIYQGAGAAVVEDAFPGTVRNGSVDRRLLARKVMGDPEKLNKLESLIHPMVRADEDRFVREHRAKGTPIILLDIPLLFETGGQDRVDYTIVVTADPQIQRQRVLDRKNMTPEKLDAIIARQLPDSEKRSRADFVIDTGLGYRSARDAVTEIIKELRHA